MTENGAWFTKVRRAKAKLEIEEQQAMVEWLRDAFASGYAAGMIAAGGTKVPLKEMLKRGKAESFKPFPAE